MVPSSSRSEFSNSPGFQASATKQMRTPLFCVITQHIRGNNPEECSTQLPWTSPSLMMKASRSLTSSQNANPETQRHIPEDSKSHCLCCRNLRSHSIRYFWTVVTLEAICYWSARCFVIQDVLGSILILETDYWIGVSSSFYLFPQTFVALKRIRTLQNHDLLTILHSDGIHSGQLTDYCEYHRVARLTCFLLPMHKSMFHAPIFLSWDKIKFPTLEILTIIFRSLQRKLNTCVHHTAILDKWIP